MILLRQKRYGPAVDLLSTVMGHPAFEDLPENVQAIWKSSPTTASGPASSTCRTEEKSPSGFEKTFFFLGFILFF
jgi:hypothetical protein